MVIRINVILPISDWSELFDCLIRYYCDFISRSLCRSDDGAQWHAGVSDLANMHSSMFSQPCVVVLPLFYRSMSIHSRSVRLFRC